MKKDNILKLRQELLVLKTLNIKPNYSELSRLYGCDRRTVQKYNNGYSKENLTRDKTSKLDKYKEDIKNKKLKPNKNNKVHLRFETEYGKQLQFNWKEDIKKISKNGELFEFNNFSATLGASRLHVFLYSKNKTRIDVQRCLVKTFKYIGGVPQELLTDKI